MTLPVEMLIVTGASLTVAGGFGGMALREGVKIFQRVDEVADQAADLVSKNLRLVYDRALHDVAPETIDEYVHKLEKRDGPA